MKATRKKQLALCMLILSGTIFAVALAYFGLTALITCAGLTDTSEEENSNWCYQSIGIILAALIPCILSFTVYRAIGSPAADRTRIS
ncbi:MAG: hypothetical protein Phyf2KO_01680 [Phycisphaerales bacterium]